MILTRGEKVMGGIALAILMLCLAVVRMSCSSNDVGTITIRANKSAGKIVQPKTD